MKICPNCESGYHDSHTTCPTHGVMLSEIRDLRPGMLIRGTYRIVEKLGKGGMGAVYLAQHTLMNEPRALKFLSQDLSEDDEFTTRFLREVRTLRQVRNRNVVDCGDPERAEDGSLFFSMEYVAGPNLRSFLKTAPRPFDVALALEITRGIAEGLGAAHSKGMVHRDIKPDNILMARDGEHWIPKIADFGIVATKESGHQTRTGNMLLTMAYAAPEQWTGTRAADLDGRTDLYALGGVLFDMLTGHPVFDAENYHEWAQKHLNTAPRAPSSLRPALAKWRGLDALVLRLLAKDRNARPQGVPELLLMLDAIVYDPSVPDAVDPDATMIVSPPRQNYNSMSSRPGTGAGSRTGSSRSDAETSLPLPTPQSGAYAPGSSTYARREEAETSLPLPRPQLTEFPPITLTPTPAQREFTGHEPIAPPPAPPESRDTGAYPILSRSTTRRSPAADSRNSGSYQTINRATRTGPRPSAASKSEPEEKSSKGKPVVLWILLILILAGGGYAAQKFFVPKIKFVTLLSQSQPILSIAFSPNGLTLASASHDNTIQFWDIGTAKALNELQDHVDALAFSPHGSSLATADWDKSVKLWDVANGQVLDTFDDNTGKVNTVAFSPDGHLLASGGSDKTVRLWDLTSEKLLHVLAGHKADINSVAFSPDSAIVASGGEDNVVKLWDATSGRLLRTLQGHTRPVNVVAFSPDGHTLASGSDDSNIILWDVSSGQVTRTLTGHTGPVRSVAFSPDGQTLASGSDDSTVKLWHATGSPEAYSTLQGQAGAINAVAFSPDSSIVASGSADNSVRLWYMYTIRK
jgi:WD40 repeat protein